MTVSLLPDDFDEQVKAAVKEFWSSRTLDSTKQKGNRGKVISGKNMNGFLSIVESVAVHCGLPLSSIHTKGRTNLTVPGYYRPTKRWDAVIIHKQRLMAALELKSQVGSLGNNFNNRVEESLGNADDFWLASKKGAYHPSNYRGTEHQHKGDPRPPFLGYLMLLESSAASNKVVKTTSPHFHTFDVFTGTSYAERYRLFCERIMEQNRYQAASILLSPPTEGAAKGTYTSPSQATSIGNLFAQLAARLLADTHQTG